MKILITGGNGFIARNLVKGLVEHEITTITRADFDLTDPINTTEYFKDKYFDVVIHTAVVGGSRLKQDGENVQENNLAMYFNLVANEKHFGKFISFGSGAEIGMPTDPYGYSKKVIRESINSKPNYYNIRIFAVFGEDELDTRFIKANIKRYINNEPMQIHQNKYMDFFYINDLVKLVDYYIKTETPPKEIECSYIEPRTLYHIVDIINHLDKYKVDIEIKEHKLGRGYVGGVCQIIFGFEGLEKGIINVYNKLKHE